jgi:hypothetical protein
MTITDLVMNFRAGLLGLVPCFEGVGISWKRPEAYDEWDRCAAAVFQALIVEPLRSSRPAAEQESFRLPDYDMLLSTYAGLSIIEVVPANPDAPMKVFHALGTAASPFDVVELRSVCRDGLPQSDVLETTPLEGARFALRMYANSLSAQMVENVAVPSRHGRL